MGDGIREIIESLERQRTAIDNALDALRMVADSAGPVSRPAGAGRKAARPAKRKGGMTPEGRKRLADAMRRRWAVKRAASQVKKRRRGPAKKKVAAPAA